MALQGSLEDFALPDVLSLLASTRKSGELQVAGGRGTEGRVWLDGGRIVFSETGTTNDAVDTLFELLRLDEGNFHFSADVDPPSVGEARDIAPLVTEAQGRLDEWKIIEAVVPSLSTRAALVSDLVTEDVIVNAAQWRVLVAVANGGTVDAVATSLGLGEFSACKSVKALVDLGLVSVDPDAQPIRSDDVDVDSLVQFTRRGRRAASAASKAAAGEAAEEPAPSPAVEELRDLAADDFADDDDDTSPLAAHALARQLAARGVAEESDLDELDDDELLDEHGEPINRSLLLKFLSSVRS